MSKHDGLPSKHIEAGTIQKRHTGGRTGPKGITLIEVKVALRKHAGVLSRAAAELGIERQTLRERIERSADLQQFVAEIDAEVNDLADTIVIDTLSRRDGAGRPAKEARDMAKWMKDYNVRKAGMKLRLEHVGKDGAELPAPVVSVTIRYVGPKDGGDVL